MHSNYIQKTIDDTVRDLYSNHDTVNKVMFDSISFKNIKHYFIVLEDGKPTIYDSYIPRMKETDGILELISATDSPLIYEEYFINAFTKNEDYGIYIDEDEIGYYITSYGGVQIFDRYIQVDSNDYSAVERLTAYLKPYPKEKDLSVEYELVVSTSKGFSTTTCSSSRNIDVDIKKNYNDDFPYEEYKNFCEKEGSGLALMYGTAGTGKTSAIKKLIYDCKDTNFYIMDFSMLQNIVSGEFVSFLLNLKDAVIIMEDCEYILKRRETHENPLINSLLNITDGLIGDALNIKFLCTFNARLTEIDTALLRPGRLKLKYEFKALSKDKTKALCGDDKEETLAEIYNREKVDYSKSNNTKKIGF